MGPFDADVSELLEQEEKKVQLRDAEAARGNSADLIPTPAVSRDPRRHTRDSERDDRLSNQNRYSAEREEHNERRSRRSKDLVDEDMKDGSEKGSANGSVRDRDRRPKSPDSPRHSRHSPVPRDRHDRGGDYYDPKRVSDDDRYYRPSGGSRGTGRPSNRDRDRSRSPRRRDDHRDDRYDDRHDDRDAGRYRDRAPYGGRERRRSPGDSARGSGRPKAPAPTDDERDSRTVFVQQLAARLREKDLQRFFEQVGPVAEVTIVKDRVSGRSKGVGYVEFKDEESVQKSIQLTGQKLLGIPIIAQLTEAEKNRQARTTPGTATQSNGVPFHRLYVGNIHFSITEEDLKEVFEPFGELEFVQLQKEEVGRSKGYGFVQFVDPAQAKDALEKMNGFELAGRPIRVGLGNDKFTPESTQSLLQRFGSQAQQAALQGSSFSGMGGRGAHAGGTANFDRSSGRDTDRQGGASALDDSDVGGVNFSNYSRDALMRKLARTEDTQPETRVTQSVQREKKPASTEESVASRCVLIKNLYIQAEQTQAGWQKEIEDDVREECQEKYGIVVHCGVALDNDDGEVFVKFDRLEGGKNAYQGLNGRRYEGRMITATYVVEAIYNMIFPKAASV